MASVSSGSRDCHQGEASMEAEAREMSRLAAKAANMSLRMAVAAERSRRAAEAARRSRCAVDAADWSGRAAEAAEMSRRATNAAEMSRRAAAAWENFSRAGDDCYRRMHAIVHSQMDQISGWARLQDDMKASFEQATSVIRQLNESNAKLLAEHDVTPRTHPPMVIILAGSRLAPQINTSLFCALCPHSCAPGSNFPVGHPS